MKVNLRRDNAQKMTVVQGDESLIFLSNNQYISESTQLETGGVYVSQGSGHVHTLPVTGNRVMLDVESGSCQVLGVSVDGVDDPVLSVGRYDFRRHPVLGWRRKSGSGGLLNFETYTATSITAAVGKPLIWVDTSVTATVTLPAGLPDNTTFGVVRGGAGDVIVTSPDGRLVGGGQSDDIRINETSRIVWLKKGADGWGFAV